MVNVDFEMMLRAKPDFFQLPQNEQVKYMSFLAANESFDETFLYADVKRMYTENDIPCPKNFSRPMGKLLAGGKNQVLIRKSGRLCFHHAVKKQLELELAGVTNSGEKSQRKQSITGSLSTYSLHSRIINVSSKQFEAGFYKEAIQNAFVEVISYVKETAGNPMREGKNGRVIELDGDDLMNEVFGCDGNSQPRIKFNTLQSSLDRAEQRGLMYLYKGIVGIRDKKSHMNFVQIDQVKTLEYLALASLLIRLLEENSMTKGD